MWVLFGEVTAVCSDGSTKYGVYTVATVRRVVMFKHLAHVVVTMLCRVEIKKEPLTCWWDTLRTVWSLLLLEKVFVWSHARRRSTALVRQSRAWTQIQLRPSRKPLAQAHYFRVTQCATRKGTWATVKFSENNLRIEETQTFWIHIHSTRWHFSHAIGTKI